jgi:protein phosphatase
MQMAVRTHTGLLRDSNQDWLEVDGDMGVAVLADGMGGHRAGEIASRVAVGAAFNQLLSSQREHRDDDAAESRLLVGQAVDAANRALSEMCEVHPELSGMGTTLVLAVFRDGQVFHAHVGDSRLYRVRYGRMRRLTRDHSLIQRMIDDGMFLNRAAAREAGIRDNVLTRSLGIQREAEVDVGSAVLEVGDTYLMCSDGLHGLIPDSAMAHILRDPQGDLEEQVQSLVDAALAAGGHDNISVILARPRLD